MLLIGNTVRAEKPLVVASIRPLALVINDLAGDLVSTEILVENSASPHDFSMTISQAMRLSDADLLVWVGADFETFLANGFKAKKAVAMLKTSAVSNHHHDKHEQRDFHAWLSYQNIMVFSEELALQLKALLPDKKSLIDDRLQVFKQELSSRNSALNVLLEPYREIPFAVHHDGYSAFVEAYKLNQLITLTKVPQERISAKRLNQIGNSIEPVSCLLTEKADLREAKRYADLFEKPLVGIDLLASDLSISSYSSYLASIAQSFVECLSTEK